MTGAPKCADVSASDLRGESPEHAFQKQAPLAIKTWESDVDGTASLKLEFCVNKESNQLEKANPKLRRPIVIDTFKNGLACHDLTIPNI